MANTIKAVILSGEDWQDVSMLTGIPTGTGITIQNLSAARVLLAISNTKPAANFVGSVIKDDPTYMGYVTNGESQVWLKGSGAVSIQEG